MSTRARSRGGLWTERYGRCLISGCAELLALDAAHIDPVRNDGSDALDNGLLLRADIHRLFDAGLVTIMFTKGEARVAIAQALQDPMYMAYVGRNVVG